MVTGIITVLEIWSNISSTKTLFALQPNSTLHFSTAFQPKRCLMK
jgi:hypothetical protein